MGFKIDNTTQTINPFWSPGQLLHAKVYLSLRQTPVHYKELSQMPSLNEYSAQVQLLADQPDWLDPKDYTRLKKKTNKATSVLLYERQGITFDWNASTAHATHSVNLTQFNTPPKLWKAALAGQSLSVHAYLGHQDRSLKNIQDYKFVMSQTSTTKTVTKKAVKPTWRLFPVFCAVCGDPNASVAPPLVLPQSAIRNAPPTPHWKPRAAFRFVADFTQFPRGQIPPLMAPHFRLNRQGLYLPFSFADEVGLTTDKLIALNQTVTRLPLEIEISPSSLGRWQLGAMMDQSIQGKWRAFVVHFFFCGI